MMQKADDFPRIWPSLFWIVAYFALQLIATIGAFAVAVIHYPNLKDDFGKADFVTKNLPYLGVPTLWGIILSGAFLLLLIWIYVRKNDRMETLGLTNWGQMGVMNAFGLGIILVLGSTAFNWLYITYVVPGVELQVEVEQILNAIPETPVNIALRFATVALIAPIVEEVLFRGLLQNALMKYMPPMAAIFCAALLFAAVHMQLYATPALMILGAAFGYLYYRTGSLRTNIVLHVINNALALMLLKP
jgi:uncharacterized protein